MRLNTIFLPFLCLLVFANLSAVAQDCHVTRENEKVFSKHPESKRAFEEFNAFTERFIEKHRNSLRQKAAASYTIPVVFHVYGSTQHGQTVTYDKIKVALEKLNDDFNGRNDDFNTIDPVFDGRKSTLSINFALAKIDPNGGSTNGVVFYPEKAGYGNGGGYDDQIAADAWDNYKYMNVYIMGDLYADGKATNSGVAWYPNTSMSNNNTARVVYNGRYLHGNTNKEFASVLTHEFGHWLNLIHTFEGGCNDPNGDYVSDTPKEDSNSGDDGCTVGASDCGNLINYENYMGYDSAAGCAKMYTQGQVNRMLAALEHPARKPLWQAANLVATGVNLNKGSLVVSDKLLEEALANDGSLEAKTPSVSLTGATFAQSSGNMTLGTHFEANLPQGVTAQISVLSATEVKVSFAGKAVNHAKSDNMAASIKFKDAAISGGIASLNTDKISFSFSFYDPYKVVYFDNPDYTANAGKTWTFFRLHESSVNSYGTFFENNALKLETYKKALVCQTGTRNPTPIAANTVIDSQSSWVAGGAYPDLHVIRDASYTAWDGKTAYIGFQLQLYPGKVNYGWFRVQVNADGSSYTLLDYAYSTEPFGAIKAGSKTWDGTPVPTCDDGIQNGDETGVDCGGSCAPCTPTLTYCSSKGNSTNDEFISKVQVNSYSNTSTGSSGGYGDYTATSVVNLPQGQEASITVTPSWRSTVYSEGYSVWIDYNQDGDFEDAGEQVWSKAATKDTSVTGSFTVPTTATLGATRLRVSMKYNGVPTACENFNYGEVEDYKITITEAAAPSCNDGIQNGDETGIDCGGSCAPCTGNSGVVYVDVADFTVSASDTWKFFRIEAGDNKDYGAWYSSNSVRLVTYNKQVVCEGSSNQASYLAEGSTVGAASNFVAESHSYIVSNSSYTNWNGKTGFIGFQFTVNNATHYGWFHVQVASNGLSYTVLDYAYQTLANTPIVTVNKGVTGPVKRQDALGEVRIFPNPFSSSTTLDLSSIQGEAAVQIQVFDMLGKQLYTKTVPAKTQAVQLTETALPKSGIYLLKIKSRDFLKTISVLKK
ncbi:conserved exported hypothetical protein [Tenacibaculum litopenaei]|uniref:M43 family zinc metalloprotease n=1 Tax=Tenacibaculum litopenaei TaxID=396016 RepID=UPI003895D990